MGKKSANPGVSKADSEEPGRYEQVVRCANEQIEWVRTVYKWVFGCVTLIFVVGVTFAVIFIGGDMNELKDRLNQEVDIVQRRVENRIDDEFKKENISRLIEEKAEENVVKQANLYLEQITDSLEKKAAAFEKVSQDMSDSLDKLNDRAELLYSITMAQSDDRKAYDRLKSWGRDDSYEHSDMAFSAFKTIDAKYVGSPSLLYMEYPDPNNELANLSFSELLEGYHQVSKWYHPCFVVRIYEREDFPKKIRLEFLISVLQDDEHLTAVHLAGKRIAKEANLDWNPFNIPPLVRWWEENRDDYDNRRD